MRLRNPGESRGARGVEFERAHLDYGITVKGRIGLLQRVLKTDVNYASEHYMDVRLRCVYRIYLFIYYLLKTNNVYTGSFVAAFFHHFEIFS